MLWSLIFTIIRIVGRNAARPSVNAGLLGRPHIGVTARIANVSPGVKRLGARQPKPNIAVCCSPGATGRPPAPLTRARGPASPQVAGGRRSLVVGGLRAVLASRARRAPRP